MSTPGSTRGVPHRSARNLDRDLMFVDEHGSLCKLTSSKAKHLIKRHRSVRRAAKAIGVPKSTLHDLALDQNKLHAAPHEALSTTSTGR